MFVTALQNSTVVVPASSTPLISVEAGHNDEAGKEISKPQETSTKKAVLLVLQKEEKEREKGQDEDEDANYVRLCEMETKTSNGANGAATRMTKEQEETSFAVP